jgi:hypothetical protein
MAGYNLCRNGEEMWPVRAGAPSSSSNLLVIDGSSTYNENDRLINTIKITEIIIIHTPYYLRYTILLLFLSYRKPSNGENYTLRYYYALTASTSYNRRSLVNLFMLSIAKIINRSIIIAKIVFKKL